MPDALAVVKVGNSEWLLRRLTPSRAMAAMVGAVLLSTIRNRRPSATKSTTLCGRLAGACANAIDVRNASIAVPRMSSRRIAHLRIGAVTAVLAATYDACVTAPTAQTPRTQ